MAGKRTAYQDRIIADPAIMVGKPVVKGTRIPVETVLRVLAENPDLEELFAEYPRLTMADVRACLAYAGELVAVRLADWLTSHGHDATAIARDYPRSLPDEDVLTITEREGRILITNDTDFGELVLRQRRPHAGVILFRLHSETLAARSRRLTAILREHADQLGQFLVVTDTSVRVRETERDEQQ